MRLRETVSGWHEQSGSFGIRRRAAETSFSDTDARDECDRAKAFLQRIRDLLLANGFTTEELRAEVLEG